VHIRARSVQPRGPSLGGWRQGIGSTGSSAPAAIRMRSLSRMTSIRRSTSAPYRQRQVQPREGPERPRFEPGHLSSGDASGGGIGAVRLTRVLAERALRSRMSQDRPLVQRSSRRSCSGTADGSGAPGGSGSGSGRLSNPAEAALTSPAARRRSNAPRLGNGANQPRACWYAPPLSENCWVAGSDSTSSSMA
jgi:hypothetical protein